MTVRSAGILLFRRTDQVGGGVGVEVLLGHMGGPFWARKDAGAWSIPKGEYAEPESPWAAARREFAEELGMAAPEGSPIPLGEVVQRNGKVVTAYALEGDLDAAAMVSNTFELEWPPHSGRVQEFPELDRAAWFTPAQARTKVLASQVELLDRFERELAGSTG